MSQFLHNHGANIIHSDQHSTDPQGGDSSSCARTFTSTACTWRRSSWSVPSAGRWPSRSRWKWRLWYTAQPKRMGIMVRKYYHCFLDLLVRRRRATNATWRFRWSSVTTTPCDATMFGVLFAQVGVTRDDKAEAEAEHLRLFHQAGVDFVVLARYMQILSGELLRGLGVPVINIHHSFLPAFIGANPYRAAFQRGVKLVGATAHYVTEELDAGPIIEQDVARVTHRETPDTLMRLGRDVERQVLARAVKAHVEDRVLVSGNKTVVF